MVIKVNDQEINMTLLNQYMNGNSKDLSTYFNGVEPFIDLIITSPPYWDMKDYGGIEEQIGFKQNYENYLNDIKTIFKAIYKLSKHTATLYVNVDTMKRNGKLIRLPDDIARVLEEVGWSHQDTIIWDKVKTLPWSRKGQTRNVFEYILMFTKGDSKDYKYYVDRIKTVDDLMEWWVDYPERYSPEGKVPANIWQYVIPTQGSWGAKKDFGDEEFKHACPFPPELMARLILLSSDENDVVFDPFAGTGILLATAKQLNRKFLGFDTNPEYKKVFEKVTIPLVEGDWLRIEENLREQDNKRKIFREVIYKLRVLKVPKALIKKTRNLHNKGKINIKNNFLMVFALEEKLNKAQLQVKNKEFLGKVNYIFVWEDNNTIAQATELINDILAKSPFTKYGLLIQPLVISKDELRSFVNDVNMLDFPLYSYTRGRTNSFSQEINIRSFMKLIGTTTYYQFYDNDIPPIISNIKIDAEDYEEIERIEYQKR
ncbi:site-specific DNA-methyltransferase [Priestia megaterium]|uniref:DNA-methyltransferase n=1 Tax=Priestia megaterium TaxID=1404 RepID=UPI0030C9DB21